MLLKKKGGDANVNLCCMQTGAFETGQSNEKHNKLHVTTKNKTFKNMFPMPEAIISRSKQKPIF